MGAPQAPRPPPPGSGSNPSVPPPHRPANHAAAIAATTMPKRKKQDQQKQPLDPQVPKREEIGDEDDGSPTGPPSLLGPPPIANGKPGDPKSDKSDRPVCRHFAKKGHCRYEDLCAFYHPGVNGPPL